MDKFFSYGLTVILRCFCVLIVMYGLTQISHAQAPSCQGRTALLQSMALPLIDDVPYASHPAVTQRYGASLYEHKTRPILTDYTVVDMHDNFAVVMVEFDAAIQSPAGALSAQIKFNRPEDMTGVTAALIVGNEGASSRIYGADMTATLEASAQSKTLAGSGLFPETAAALSGLKWTPWSDGGCETTLSADIDASQSAPITFMALALRSETPRRIRIDAAGLVYKTVPMQPEFFSGQILDAQTRWPGYIELDYENGQSRRVTPSLTGAFVFEDEFPKQGLRVSFKKKGQEHYPVQGRWIGARRALGALQVKVKGEYINIDGHKSDKNCLLGETPSARLLIAPLLRPGHAMTKWCGATGRVQELYNRHFLSAAGMHDQDFDLAPKDDCLRVAHIGHSSVQARQISLYEKHNIIAAERLSLELQRCVYVHTFAGNMSIVSEPRLDWVMENYKPDLVLFAVHRQMIQLLTPELLNATYGYKRGNANGESFDLKANGSLEYIPADPRYALKPKDEPQRTIDDYPLALAYNLPLDAMPSIAKKSFDTVEALLARYKTKYPSVKFGLEYSHTIAECDKANYCQKSVTFKGKPYRAGAEGYADTVLGVCDRAGVSCVNAPLPPPMLRAFPDLVFQYDAHYTKLGNYWQAKHVEQALAPALSAP